MKDLRGNYSTRPCAAGSPSLKSPPPLPKKESNPTTSISCEMNAATISGRWPLPGGTHLLGADGRGGAGRSRPDRRSGIKDGRPGGFGRLSRSAGEAQSASHGVPLLDLRTNGAHVICKAPRNRREFAEPGSSGGGPHRSEEHTSELQS